MIPRIGGQGSSFRGAAFYYLRDKEAETDERVEFTHTRNLPTEDPEVAWRWMAQTAMDSERLKHESGVDPRGAKSEKPVLTLSLSWHPDERPEQAHMIGAMEHVLDRLGLTEHQALLVSHNDEPQPHIHAIVNLVHPQSGRSAQLRFSKENLSAWAEEYEREHGIYCEQRLANNEKRAREKSKRAQMTEVERDEQRANFARHKEEASKLREAISARYFAADSGKAFAASMAEMGLTVAQGRRLMLVDQNGKQWSLYRQVEGAKAKDIKAKLADLVLESVDDVRARHQNEKYFDRDKQEREQDERVIDAALARDEEEHGRSGATAPEKSARALSPGQQAIKTFGRDRPGLPGAPFDLRSQSPHSTASEAININRLQDAQLGEWGAFYERNHRDREAAEATIESQYGSAERRLRQQIFAREQKFARAGWLQRWYLKNFTQESHSLDNDRRTLASLQQRSSEIRGSLERTIADERRALEERHAGERDMKQPPARPTPSATRAASAEQQHAVEEHEGEEQAASPLDVHVLHSADPLAASIQAQQQSQSAAFLGAARPGYVASTYDASQPHPTDYAAQRAAYMDTAAAARETPQQAAAPPAPSEGQS